MDLLWELGSNFGIIRVFGIGFFYNELVKGVLVIFGYFLIILFVIYFMVIFVCIKYVFVLSVF